MEISTNIPADQLLKVLFGLVVLLVISTIYFALPYFKTAKRVNLKSLKEVLRAIKDGSLTDRESAILARAVIKLMNYRGLHSQNIFKFHNDLVAERGFLDDDETVEVEKIIPLTPQEEQQQQKKQLKLFHDEIKDMQKKRDENNSNNSF